MSTFAHRILGAASLNVATYEEIERDPKATLQALVVVVLAGVAAGAAAGRTVHAVAILSVIALLSWVAWAAVAFEVARQLLPEPRMNRDFGRLLRTFGFAAAPGLLRVSGFVPGLAWPAAVVTAVWMMVAMVIALRQALDFQSTARAVAVCVLGWLLSVGLAFGVQMALNISVS